MTTTAAPPRSAFAVPGNVGRIACGLGAVGVLLVGSGLVTRLAGLGGVAGALLSMDAVGSLARLFITGVLATAAGVAGLGAYWRPGRRAWWLGVAAIAGALAAGKAAGDVHSGVVSALGAGILAWRGMVVFGLLAASALAVLWWLSAGDRRDRRRVTAALAAYAFAAVGLSAVSTYARLLAGETAGAVATFVEESAEGLSAVALLVVVLVGVVPRLVLPASVPLRRADDELPPALRDLARPRR